MRLRNDRGSSFVLALLFPIVVYGFIGLVFDGGAAMNAAASATDLAQSAARTGGFATTASPSGEQVIDVGAANARAQELIAQFPDATGSVAVSGTAVTVTVTWTYVPELFPWPGWTFTKVATIDATEGTAVQGD